MSSPARCRICAHSARANHPEVRDPDSGPMVGMGIEHSISANMQPRVCGHTSFVLTPTYFSAQYHCPPFRFQRQPSMSVITNSVQQHVKTWTRSKPPAMSTPASTSYKVSRNLHGWHWMLTPLHRFSLPHRALLSGLATRSGMHRSESHASSPTILTSRLLPFLRPSLAFPQIIRLNVYPSLTCP